LLDAMENAGDNLIKFLRRDSWRTSSMFAFIASSLGLALMMIDWTALDTKYPGDPSFPPYPDVKDR
jgi:hypothetical protein